MWIETVQHWYPHLVVRTTITPNALRFVTPTMLKVAAHGGLYGSGWPSGSRLRVPHRELAEWADGVIVMPASGNSVAKLALGIADTFAVNVVANALCPVVVVPSVSPVRLMHRGHLDTLRHGGVAVVSTEELDADNAGPLPSIDIACIVMRGPDAAMLHCRNEDYSEHR